MVILDPYPPGRTAAARARVVVMHNLPPHNEAYIWVPLGPNTFIEKPYIYIGMALQIWRCGTSVFRLH